MTAVPDPGYRFVAWTTPDDVIDNPLVHTVVGDQTLPPAWTRCLQTGRVRATYDSARARRCGKWQLVFSTDLTPGGVDLRGWRITDNDSKIALDEGSLIFADHPALARVGQTPPSI